MFTYPINRLKLLVAKLIIVSIWLLLAIVLSNPVVEGTFVLINERVGAIPGPLEMSLVTSHFGRILLNAVGGVGMSLISLYFGLRRRSTAATIVSAIVAIVLLDGIGSPEGPGFMLQLALIAIGIAVAYLSIRNVEKADLV